MELSHKQKILNTLLAICIFPIFLLLIWGISVLSDYFKTDIFYSALQKCIDSSNKGVPSIKTLELEKKYSSLSIQAFKAQSDNVSFYFFLVPTFTNNGLDTVVFFSTPSDIHAIQYLGLLSRDDNSKISNAALYLASEKIKQMLMRSTQ